MSAWHYRLAADLILLVHVLFVAFVVGGLAVIWIGYWRRWAWIRHRLFRLCHLAAILVVVVQSWLGRLCPLTIWEMWLRRQAGQATYPGAFIAHHLERLLYYQAPPWVFALAYTLFALAVLASWVFIPPRPFTPKR